MWQLMSTETKKVLHSPYTCAAALLKLRCSSWGRKAQHCMGYQRSYDHLMRLPLHCWTKPLPLALPFKWVPLLLLPWSLLWIIGSSREGQRIEWIKCALLIEIESLYTTWIGTTNRCVVYGDGSLEAMLQGLIAMTVPRYMGLQVCGHAGIIP
jgi:hypothetical protein